MEPFSLQGKNALVLGAAGGIGRATASCISRLGARVWLADVKTPTAVAAEIEAAGGLASALQCDAARRDSVEAAVAACGWLDVAVYAAAINPWDDWREAGWDSTLDKVIAVNLKGAIDFSRAVMDNMKGRGGRIVLISSLAGRNGGLIASPHYVASKGGINALVKWLARQGAPDDILVNAVAPASIRTPMMEGQPVDVGKIPLGRMGEPEEVAGPVAFLCSPAASYMTGTILDVNGGVYM
jgi:NAD(P)-dependent dehydrogenase (short-subunit alcohol dehydrogenase family)